jgi:hypothetical protein
VVHPPKADGFVDLSFQPTWLGRLRHCGFPRNKFNNGIRISGDEPLFNSVEKAAKAAVALKGHPRCRGLFS